jgi:hypothetical protein
MRRFLKPGQFLAVILLLLQGPVGLRVLELKFDASPVPWVLHIKFEKNWYDGYHKELQNVQLLIQDRHISHTTNTDQLQ